MFWSGNLILINPALRIEERAEFRIQETNMSPDNSELTWHYFSSRIFASTISGTGIVDCNQVCRQNFIFGGA